MQRYRSQLIGFTGKVYFLRSRKGLGGVLPEVILQFALFARGQSRGDDFVSSDQNNLATRYESELLRHGRIDLIANRKRSKLFSVGSRSRRNGANESPIQLVVRIP